MSYVRTPELRRLQAERIQKWRPWEKATGPRTDLGKAISSGNATKHGLRSRAAQEELKQLTTYLRQCQSTAR